MLQEELQGQLSSPVGLPGDFKGGGSRLSSVGVSQVKGRLRVSPPATNPQRMKVLAAQQAGLSRKQDLMAAERPLTFQQLSRFFQCFFPNSTFPSTATCEPLLLFRGPAAGGSKILSNFLLFIRVRSQPPCDRSGTESVRVQGLLAFIRSPALLSTMELPLQTGLPLSGSKSAKVSQQT